MVLTLSKLLSKSSYSGTYDLGVCVCGGGGKRIM
jgi:hypothetical protein